MESRLKRLAAAMSAVVVSAASGMASFRQPEFTSDAAYGTGKNIAEYLDNKGYNFSRHIDNEEYDIDKYSETDLLVTLCRRLHPHGVLMKEDIREIVNDYINDMINRSY